MPINFLKKILQQHTATTTSSSCMNICPSKSCTDYIENFYLFYDLSSATEQYIFNDGFPSIILFPDKENRVSLNIDGSEKIINSGWLDGGVIKKVYVNYLEELDYVLVIRFRPEYFYSLFNLNSSIFRHKNIIPIKDFANYGRLFNDIFSVESIEERICIIETFLERLVPLNTNIGSLVSALNIITENKGHISVAQVVQKTGLSYKWLERNFNKHLGITPKEYIQLQRFISAYISIQNKSNDLLGVSISNGYYDYNHYLKEFKEFTGKTPLQFMSK